jgi:hypothetical protein
MPPGSPTLADITTQHAARRDVLCSDGPSAHGHPLSLRKASQRDSSPCGSGVKWWLLKRNAIADSSGILNQLNLMIFRILRVGAVSAALFAPFLHAAQPWDSPFAADTHSILEAAARILPSEHPEVIVLLEDHRYSIHSDGRMGLRFDRPTRCAQNGFRPFAKCPIFNVLCSMGVSY